MLLFVFKEFIDEILRIAIYLTYFGEKITENMWELWKVLYSLIMSPSGGEYMPGVCPLPLPLPLLQTTIKIIREREKKKMK
jgi:hypothetical protein